MRSSLTALSLLLASGARVQAAPNLAVGDPSVDLFGLVIPDSQNGDTGLSARQLVPETVYLAAPGPLGLAQSRTIYLNRGGVTVAPAATNDSRSNKSTIVSKTTTIPPWSVDQPTWDATVTCMRELFAPFAVHVVTTDPGSTPHLEAIFGGSPTLLGLPAGIVGVSPFTSACSIIENSVVYTFTAVLPANPRVICEIMAQEIAHSYGLDHELLAADPMTYLSFNGKRAFQDQAVACGESTARPCGINGSICRAQQNSVLLLRERLGVADPVSPTSTFVAPSQGEVVGADFEINVTASDNIGVTSVEFFLDDASLGKKTSAPFTMTVQGLAAGDHTVAVVVSDSALNVSRNSIAITVEPEPTHGLLQTCAAGGEPASRLLPLATAMLVLLRRRRRHGPG